MEAEWKTFYGQATFKSIYDIAHNGPIVHKIGLARFGLLALLLKKLAFVFAAAFTHLIKCADKITARF